MTDQQLTIEQEGSGSEVVLRLTGELDPHTSEQLGAAIGAIPDMPSRLVLDLSGVTFLDSSGLRAILAADRRASEHGAELVLRSPSDTARWVLEVADLTEALNVE